MTHSPQQILVFFQYLQNGLGDKFLHQELKDRKKGISYETKRLLERLPDPAENRQDLYEMLWAFCKMNGITHGSVVTALHGHTELLDDFEEAKELKQKVNNHLEMLGIPKFKEETNES